MEMPSFLQSKESLSETNSKGSMFGNKKKLSIISLVILLLAIPLTIWLIQTSKIFSPKATGGPIELVTGTNSCVVSADPAKVTCTTFPIKLTSPLGPNKELVSCTEDSQCGTNEKCFKQGNYPGSCKDADVYCNQAIVRACNPTDPSECVDFGNSCVVPPGWIAPSPVASASSSASLKKDMTNPFTSLLIAKGKSILNIISATFVVKDVFAQANDSTLTATPNPCIITSGLTCTSTITWNAGNRSNVKISIREVPGSLFASGPSGTQAAPWIPAAGVTFDLYSGETLLKSLFVRGNPLISAFPTVCNIPTGSETCTSTISWDAGARTDVKITIKEAPGSLFATGPSGTQAAPWIRASGATFEIYSGSNLLGSVFVKGVVGGSPEPSAGLGLIKASPNPCNIASGSETCSSTITWNSGNRSNVKISVREVPGSLFASGPSGTQAAPWIRSSGATFDLYSGATLIDSIFVKGVDPNASPSASPSSPRPSGVGTIKYRVAETEAGLQNAEFKPYNEDPLQTEFTFKDTTPGSKQIWVEFIGTDNSSKKEHISVELAEPDPVIASLDCSVDISKKNLKLTLNGSRFGTGSGKVTANSKEAQVLTWQNGQVSATIDPGENLDDGKLFKVILTRSDGKALPEVSCQINTTLISLGARLFCREPGKFDVNGVKITLVDENGNKVNEEVTIDKDGIIKGLKTRLQVGKPYVISIKAPFSLRRNALFTAANGTNVVTLQDGTSFILPIGDIAPVILNDGKINTLDHAEIIRQWAVFGNTVKTADFNRDTKVNSIDWACMRYDFNKEDDAVPTTAALPTPSPIPSPIPNTSSSPSSSATTSPSPIASGQRVGYFLIEPVGGGSYKNDDEFVVNINIWSQNEEANLFVAKLSFDPSALEVSRIEKGTTLTSWAENYFNNQTGEISLTAGLPNPGLKTTEGANPLMAKVIFKGKKVGDTTLSMTSGSKIYSNSDNENILTSLLSSQIAITN